MIFLQVPVWKYPRILNTQRLLWRNKSQFKTPKTATGMRPRARPKVEAAPAQLPPHPPRLRGPSKGSLALAPGPAPRTPTSGVRGRSRQRTLCASGRLGRPRGLRPPAPLPILSLPSSTPTVFRPRAAHCRTLRWVRRPPAPPDWSVISYAPVTSRSLWISSRRHLRELTGRWKEMASTELGPSRSKSSSANGQGPRWAGGPDKPDMVPETVHPLGPLPRRNREGPRDSPLT